MKDKIVKKVEHLPQLTDVKRTDKLIQRVAAYARVSTEKEEQQTSIEAQKDYYSTYIKTHVGWEFVGVYADEGISGCSTKRRVQFNQLMNDCRDGKIDMVLTKSISRFGRNTVDTLNAIRELKSNGIGVYFEKEQIWTLDSKGEFIITLMSSLAQEESRSMSENILWAVRKRYAQGKGSFAYSRVLGFDRGKEKFEIVINPKEAVQVCKIFRMFLQGLTPHTIGIAMTAAGIPSPGGKDKWNSATVRRMLSNEKYKGDMLLQKEFTVDFLSKKKKKNEGELPQYYVSNNHEPIIDPWLFDYVQEQLQKRTRTKEHRYSGIGYLNSKIFCTKCGAAFGPRPWHSTSYNNIVWQCRNRYSDVECKTVNIYDNLLFYVLHDVARKKIVAKDIRTAIVEFAVDEVSPKKLKAIEQYLTDFETMSPLEMLSDADDLSFVIQRIMVKPDRQLEVKWLDGSMDRYEIPKYTPRRGIEKPV